MPPFSALPLFDLLPSLLLNYLPNILTTLPLIWCCLGTPWVCIPPWHWEHQWQWWTVLALVSTLRNILSNYPPKSNVSLCEDLPQISLWSWGEVDQSFVSWTSDCLSFFLLLFIFFVLKSHKTLLYLLTDDLILWNQNQCQTTREADNVATLPASTVPWERTTSPAPPSEGSYPFTKHIWIITFAIS